MLRIRYANGTVMQGVLLALGDQKIRVALKGSDDVAEYRLVNQRWVSEDCEVVNVGFGEEPFPFDEAMPENMVASGFDRPVARHIM
ncbi:MAG TPA: hypothetical protein VNV86_22875 [Candidatus Acidoferrum sp.]|nr:hypothetical protein [Candidatus Acidoferrum sp.]